MKHVTMDKKVMFVIHPHSIVDVITNSSTELFVIDTDKTVETIREILDNLIQVQNQLDGGNLQFNDIFDEPYLQEKDGSVDGWAISLPSGSVVLYGASDNSVPWWICEFLEYNFGDHCKHHLG